MGFSSLKKLIPGAARRAGITRDLQITDAIRACQKALEGIFGPAYSKAAEPVSLRSDGVLLIACRSAAVAQTIRIRQRAVLDAVRAAVPRIRVERLFLVPRSREDVTDPSGGSDVAP